MTTNWINGGRGMIWMSRALIRALPFRPHNTTTTRGGRKDARRDRKALMRDSGAMTTGTGGDLDEASAMHLDEVEGPAATDHMVRGLTANARLARSYHDSASTVLRPGGERARRTTLNEGDNCTTIARVAHGGTATRLGTHGCWMLDIRHRTLDVGRRSTRLNRNHSANQAPMNHGEEAG